MIAATAQMRCCRYSLLHLEDLVLHDATRDIRTPTHELTIARDVLRTRLRIAASLPDWALSKEGIRILRQPQAWPGPSDGPEPAQVVEPEGEGDDDGDDEDLPGVDLAATDALLARSDAAHLRSRLGRRRAARRMAERAAPGRKPAGGAAG